MSSRRPAMFQWEEASQFPRLFVFASSDTSVFNDTWYSSEKGR